MMVGVKAQGGKRPPEDLRWFCNCDDADGMRLNLPPLARCPDCGARRP
jgi:hypothetical protein